MRILIFWVPLQNLVYLLTPDLNSNCPLPSVLKINDNKTNGMGNINCGKR